MKPASASLNLEDLVVGMPGLTARLGAAMAEGASVCLDDCGHGVPVRLVVDGDDNRVYDLEWTPIDDQARRAWADAEVATEYGACGIAILVVREIRGHSVLERSRRGTGFDYWMGESNVTPFAGKSRLEIHQNAMDWAEEGQYLLDRGDQSAARDAFRRAMEIEREAAYATDDESEPDRSVLFRSAGSLALDCEELSTAEQLLAMGLSGNPPDEIAEEIRDLLEQVQFRRHLEMRGITLETTEIQMSIAGEAVGFGIANSDEFVGRVQDFTAIILRTVERRRKQPYRERGSPKSRLKETFGIFLSVPRAASFSVTLKLGQPRQQRDLWADDETSLVIDEVLDLFEAVQACDADELARRIPELPYLMNFSALAKRIAPDGDKVSVVGLTSRRPGQVRKVALTRRRQELTNLVSVSKESTSPEIEQMDECVEVRGVLHYADEMGSRDGTIKLEDQDGSVHEILVPEGMMGDIVRPLWDDTVVVTGTRSGNCIRLEGIDPAE